MMIFSVAHMSCMRNADAQTGMTGKTGSRPNANYRLPRLRHGNRIAPGSSGRKIPRAGGGKITSTLTWRPFDRTPTALLPAVEKWKK